jgi:hypothetical protein
MRVAKISLRKSMVELYLLLSKESECYDFIYKHKAIESKQREVNA